MLPDLHGWIRIPLVLQFLTMFMVVALSCERQQQQQQDPPGPRRRPEPEGPDSNDHSLIKYRARHRGRPPPFTRAPSLGALGQCHERRLHGLHVPYLRQAELLAIRNAIVAAGTGHHAFALKNAVQRRRLRDKSEGESVARPAKRRGHAKGDRDLAAVL